jgi:hypothetical protein
MIVHWLLIILPLHLVHTDIIFEHVDYVTDPNTMRMNVDMRNYSGCMALNLDLYLMREIDGQLMVTWIIYTSFSCFFFNSHFLSDQIFHFPRNNQ